jgi:calcineurin-like phosphoesterase family protein
VTIFFSSDHHFGHKNILKYQPNRIYSDVEEMNLDMVAKWNSVVKPTDTVYYLGDFSLSVPDMQKWTPLLNGHKILIPGNHDGCFKNKPQVNQLYIDAGWEWIAHGFADMDLSYSFDPGVHLEFAKIRMCHFPPVRQPHRPKYEKYIPELNGNKDPELELRLYGHTHSTDRVTMIEGKTVSIHVGVDAWGLKPVSINSLMDLAYIEYECGINRI